MNDPAAHEPTLDDIANLVRILALTTRDTERAASNLVQPALLQQLRANIVPDGAGGAGGKGKPSNERSPINAAAFTLYEFLTDKIGQLYTQGTDRDPIGAPEELLVAWYIAIAVEAATEGLVQPQIDSLHVRLDDWRTRIMDLFNPPERGEISHACPECGWRHVTRETTEGSIRQPALVGYARPWKPEEGVRCRSRHNIWSGETAMRELAATLGITPGELHVDAPAAPKVDREPVYLLAMNYDQAKAWAKEREISLKRIVLASGHLDRIRAAHRPVLVIDHQGYTPGPHEAARVAEARRVAALVNQLNGYQTDGTPTNPAPTTETEPS